MTSRFARRFWLALYLVTLVANSAMALGPKSRGNWDCPYTTDGNCPPKRQTYGFYAPKWKRWPGVVDRADDVAMRDETVATPPATQDDAPPTRKAPPTEPTLKPEDDMPLPGLEDDMAPQIPRDTAPEQTRPTGPTKEAEPEALPFEEPGMQEPAVEQPPSRKPTTKPAEKPLDEEDPFKDDPLFNDDAPAPPGDAGSKDESRRAPTRLPAISAMRKSPGLTRVNARRRTRVAEETPNPLRGVAVELVSAQTSVIPVAAWQQPAETLDETEGDWESNPLRH